MKKIKELLQNGGMSTLYKNLIDKIPRYSKTKLLLALEYGVILGDVAKQNKLELTPEMVTRLEEIVLKEFPKKSTTRLSVDMIVNILAAFETK